MEQSSKEWNSQKGCKVLSFAGCLNAPCKLPIPLAIRAISGDISSALLLHPELLQLQKGGTAHMVHGEALQKGQCPHSENATAGMNLQGSSSSKETNNWGKMILVNVFLLLRKSRKLQVNRFCGTPGRWHCKIPSMASYHT